MENDLSIRTEIMNLFKDLAPFAETSALIDIEKYKIKLFDFYKYPLGVYFLGIKKSQCKSIKDAFCILFIADLHYQNDWIYTEASRTNDDQFLIEKLPTDKWATYLHEIWIENYFNVSHNKLNMTRHDPKLFQKKLLYWLPEGMPQEETTNLALELSKTTWVYSLFPDAFYDKFFGETDEYYFFAESGVYD